MLLRLLVSFYLAFGATVLGCLSVAEAAQYEDTDSIQRRDNNVPLAGIRIYDNVNLIGTPGKIITEASSDKPIDIKNSLEIVGNTWAVVTSTKNNTNVTSRIWASVLDISALPLPQGTHRITEIQSADCPDPCAGAGTCILDSGSPICKCADGFNGTQCEFCAKGFFGPKCQPCPSNCTVCDEGISGSGLCLVPQLSNPDCQCRNGECDSDGKCICLPGYGSSNNGTACAECQQGFYLKLQNTGGDGGEDDRSGCQTCETGCAVCNIKSGNCEYCENGYDQDPNNPKTCLPIQSGTEVGGCPPKSFYVGPNITPPCANCSAVCATCSGKSSNDCMTCAENRMKLNKSCPILDRFGVCDGTDLVADNNKQKCEGCGAIDPNCMKCIIPGYNLSSTIEDAVCTNCLVGFFLLNGKCVKSCPWNAYIPENSTTCTDCTPPCTSCAGAADFCLSCKPGTFASLGNCVNKCPQGTFASNHTCLSCHPDCKTCKGPSFGECTSCYRSLPYLKDSHCLAGCQSNQYFNFTTWTCHNCHSSCSSCLGSGDDTCLSCANSTSIVVNGRCFTVPQLAPPRPPPLIFP